MEILGGGRAAGPAKSAGAGQNNQNRSPPSRRRGPAGPIENAKNRTQPSKNKGQSTPPPSHSTARLSTGA